jgi:outer membrane protein TolC
VAVGTLSVPSASQPGPRRLSFVDVAGAAARDNLELRAAVFDVAVAEAQLAQAWGAARPQVSLTASYVRLQDRSTESFTVGNPFSGVPPTITITLPPPDPSVLAARIAVTMPLYTGGRLESHVRLAEANVRGARIFVERLGRRVVFAAQQAYLQVLLAQESFTAAQRGVAQAEESLRVARARREAGTAPEFDVLRAAVAVAAARQELVRAQTAAQTAQSELNALLNLPLDTALELTDTLEPRPVAGTLEALTARALGARPELAELRARVDAARAGLELATSGGRPNVAIAAGYDATGNFNASAGSWSVTLAVSLPLFDGGVTVARIREARLRLEQLAVLEAQTKQRIELEVQRGWLGLEQANAQLVTAAVAVAQGREAARIAGLRYEAGAGTVLDVLSAQAAFARAELELATARFQQSFSRISLSLATGGAL